MLIGVSKTGRAWGLNPAKWSTVGGDVDVYRSLDRLARAHPEDEFILVGRNSGEKPADVGLPSNVTNPWADGLADEIREVGRGRSSPMTVEERFRIVKGQHALTGPLYMKCDAHIVWAGQQGTSNLPIPAVGKPLGGPQSDLTNTQDAFILYGSYIDLGLMHWRHPDPVAREEIWVLPDPRNYLKSRSVRWPLLYPVVSQFNETREWKHERYVAGEIIEQPWHRVVKKVEDGHVWVCNTEYQYQALEHTALPDRDDWGFTVPFSERGAFGIMANENRAYVAASRAKAIESWVFPWYREVPIVGTWGEKSKQALGIDPKPVSYDKAIDTLASWRSTFTMPASGSGWATAKPWECFLAGTICFFHPKYDTQGHIVPTAQQQLFPDTLPPAWQSDERRQLAKWLRPPNPEALHKAARAIATSESTWQWLQSMQLDYLIEKWNERQALTHIEKRLGLEVP